MLTSSKLRKINNNEYLNHINSIMASYASKTNIINTCYDNYNNRSLKDVSVCNVVNSNISFRIKVRFRFNSFGTLICSTFICGTFRNLDEISSVINRYKTFNELKESIASYYCSIVMLPDNLILRLESSMEMIPNSSTLEHFQDNTVIICEINRVDRNSSVTTCFLPSYHSKIKSQGEDIRNLQNQNQILNDLLHKFSFVICISIGMALSRRILIRGN